MCQIIAVYCSFIQHSTHRWHIEILIPNQIAKQSARIIRKKILKLYDDTRARNLNKFSSKFLH